MGYCIIGDTERYKGCLVLALKGNWTKEKAEGLLNRLLTNPTEMDKKSIEGHTNLRIYETETKQEWWNDEFLVH